MFVCTYVLELDRRDMLIKERALLWGISAYLTINNNLSLREIVSRWVLPPTLFLPPGMCFNRFTSIKICLMMEINFSQQYFFVNIENALSVMKSIVSLFKKQCGMLLSCKGDSLHILNNHDILISIIKSKSPSFYIKDLCCAFGWLRIDVSS